MGEASEDPRFARAFTPRPAPRGALSVELLGVPLIASSPGEEHLSEMQEQLLLGQMFLLCFLHGWDDSLSLTDITLQSRQCIKRRMSVSTR